MNEEGNDSLDIIFCRTEAINPIAQFCSETRDAFNHPQGLPKTIVKKVDERLKENEGFYKVTGVSYSRFPSSRSFSSSITVRLSEVVQTYA